MDFNDTTDVPELGSNPSSTEDERLARHMPEASDDRSCNDAEIERLAALSYEAFSRHHKICQWLDIDASRVTAEDLVRASLADDPKVQLARLKRLFSACGVEGKLDDVDRIDLIHSLASWGPLDENEIRILYHLHATNFMAMRCAELAMADGAHPQAVALHVGNFKKLSAHCMELQSHYEAKRLRRDLAGGARSGDARIPSSGTAPLALEIRVDHTDIHPLTETVEGEGRDRCSLQEDIYDTSGRDLL